MGAIVALVLASAATAMAVPYALQTANYEGDWSTNPPNLLPPRGWQSQLWGAAAIVGLLALGFAIYQLWPPKASLRLAVLLARAALILAILGACVWAFPVCIGASAGL